MKKSNKYYKTLFRFHRFVHELIIFILKIIFKIKYLRILLLKLKIYLISILLFADVHQLHEIYLSLIFYQISIFPQILLRRDIYIFHFHEINLYKNFLRRHHYSGILKFRYHASFHYSNLPHTQLLRENNICRNHEFHLLQIFHCTFIHYYNDMSPIRSCALLQFLLRNSHHYYIQFSYFHQQVSL